MWEVSNLKAQQISNMATTIEHPDTAARNLEQARKAQEAGELLGEHLTLNMVHRTPPPMGCCESFWNWTARLLPRPLRTLVICIEETKRSPRTCNITSRAYTDRLDYLAPIANNVAYALAVEKLMGWELPPRGKAIRVICCELARISSHLVGVGCMAMDLGATTVFLYTFYEREKIYNLFELLTGARFTTNYTRMGGQTRDLPEPFIPQLREFLTGFKPVVEEVDKLLTRNRIFIDRCKDVGVISKEDAIAYALSGPNLRCSGMEHKTSAANILTSITRTTISRSQ